MPDSPDVNFDQLSESPWPSEVMTPMPVTATMDYLAIARGDITATAQVDGDIDEARRIFDSGSRPEVAITCEKTHTTGGDQRPAQVRYADAERNTQRCTVAAGAVLALPDLLHAAQIHRCHITPWRRLARQAHWRQQCFEDHAIRRAFVWLHAFGFADAWALLGNVGSRDQLRFERHVAWVHEGDLAYRVDGNATPVEHAEVAWVNDRTL